MGLPVALAVLAGAGRVPGLLEALAALCLVGGMTLAQRRLRARPWPPRHEVLLAAAGAAALAIAVAAAGWGGVGSPHPLAGDLRMPARGAAGLGGLCLLGLAWAPQLRAAGAWSLDVSGPQAGEPATPAWGRGTWLVLGVGAVAHGVVILGASGPLIQIDSWVNLAEPDLLHPWPHPYHHTPIYSGLVKILGRGPGFLVGLWALVLAQHALVLATGAVCESTVRRCSGSVVGGAVAGLLVVLCGHLSLYAQMIMSEVLSTFLVVVSLALVFAAARRARAGWWLVAAGATSALGTLTRQAMQAWFVAGVIALLLLGFARWRRALLLFLVGALVPIAAMVAHNAVFHGRASLTAGMGRTVVYRLTPGMPDLTDPDAPPGDPHERAREIVWELRGGGYAEVYEAVGAELGWSDKQIEQAMQRFYVEQILRHPGPFAKVTLGFCLDLLRGHEPPSGVVEWHNYVQRDAPAEWDGLPAAALSPSAVRVTGVQPTSSWAVLVLATLGGLLQLLRRVPRALAVACLASAAYFVGVAAMLELPLPRYRLPGIPFLAMACGLGVAGLLGVFARFRGGAE